MRNIHPHLGNGLSRYTALGAVFASMLVAAPTFADKVERDPQPETPIKHVIVIFQENRTFDNYFATYPVAANTQGEQSWVGVSAPRFVARDDTPAVNGLTPELLKNNPSRSLTGGPANPMRLGPSAAATCGNNNGYTPEQQAVHSGLVDRYPQSTAGTGEGCLTDGTTVMGYYDGNTVTALWNYAQHYAMSDNSFDTTYGPTLPGHINLVSGNTHGLVLHNATTNPGVFINPTDGSITMTSINVPGFLDDCGGDALGTKVTVEMTGKNVGDLMNAKNVTWGYFQGGFLPTTPAVLDAKGNLISPAACASQHVAHEMVINGKTYDVQNPIINPGKDVHTLENDYSTGVGPFMHYASTKNPHHLRPSSAANIGKTDQANHQYDISDFFTALSAGSLPSVSYVKAPVYQYGHPGISDPLVEQAFIVQTINAVMNSRYWPDTAIVIAWDDSDGWYDHVMPPVTTPSATNVDPLAGPGACGTPQAGADAARCGRGPRQPLMVISPWARQNFVDHTMTDQASILRFIEDNWDLGFIDGPVAPPPGTGSVDRYTNSIINMFDFDDHPDARRLILDPVTGTVERHS
ncbi:MAG TPA: alkaline phosphatase family protein [Stellaceae bacterium]|jgi:phospholipase C